MPGEIVGKNAGVGEGPASRLGSRPEASSNQFQSNRGSGRCLFVSSWYGKRHLLDLLDEALFEVCILEVAGYQVHFQNLARRIDHHSYNYLALDMRLFF